MTAKAKSYSIVTAKFLIAGGLIYWLVSSGRLDFQALITALSPKFLFVCTAMLFVQLFINHYRWVLLSRTRNFAVGFMQTFPLTLLGIFFNFAMPGAVGGDVIKALYLGRDHGNRKLAAMTTVFTDRLIGLYVMVLMSLVALLLNVELTFSNLALTNFAYLIFAIAVVGAVFFLLFLTSLYKKFPVFKNLDSATWLGAGILSKVVHAFQDYRDNKRVLLYAMILATASQLLVITFFGVVAHALGEDLSPAALMFCVSLGFIASAVPLSPGGIGVGQVAFMFFFTAYTGQKLQVGALGITLVQVIYFIFGLFGLGYFLRRGKEEINLAT